MAIRKTDLLVVGGGTAGFGAAVAGGRLGLNVTLIEASSKIGGVMAFCPGMPWGAAYPSGKIVGGIMEELATRLFAMTPPMAAKRPCTLANFGPEIQYDHDVAILTMFEMLEEAGAEVCLNATALAPVMEDGRVTSVTVADRHGVSTIEPGVVIDCTGDGDISAKAGVPFVLGDGKGNMMAVSVTFQMVGADLDRVFECDDPYFQDYAKVGIAQGRLHPDLHQLYLMRGFHPDTVFCNSVAVRGVDGTDPRQVSAAAQEGRRRCHALAEFLKSDIPGFEDARMMYLGPTAGVRETRKLEGVYRVTGADLAKGTKFPDGVVACDNPIDDVMRKASLMTHDAMVKPGDYYTIPYRSMLPKNIENLLFAGRIVSADETAFASVRGMPQCMAMGQACATAADLAMRNGVGVQAVDHGALVSALQAQGLRGLGDEVL